MPEFFYNMDVTQSLNNLREVEFETSAEATDLIDDLMHMARLLGGDAYVSLAYVGQQLGLPNRNDTSLFGWTEDELAHMVIQKQAHNRTWKIIWTVPRPIPAHPINTFDDLDEDEICNRANLLHEARDLLGEVGVNDSVQAGVVHLVANVFSWGYEEAREKIMETSTPDHPIRKGSDLRHEAAFGTVLYIGHPENKRYASKIADGTWRHLHDHSVVDDDDYRAGWGFVEMAPVVEPDDKPVTTPEVLPSSTDEMDPPETGVYTIGLDRLLDKGAEFYKFETYGDHDVMQNYGIEKLIQSITGEEEEDIRDALVQRAIKL